MEFKKINIEEVVTRLLKGETAYINNEDDDTLNICSLTISEGEIRVHTMSDNSFTICLEDVNEYFNFYKKVE